MREDMRQALLPDIDKINTWFEVTNEVSHYNDMILQILDTWAINKEPLFDAFGKKLQISKTVQFTKPDEIIDEDMDELFRTGHSGAVFRNLLVDNLEKVFDLPVPFKSINCYMASSLGLSAIEMRFLKVIFDAFDRDCLRTGVLNQCLFEQQPTLKVQLPNDHVFVITNTMKTMRLFNKLAKEFELEDAFEKFRLEHSRVLNDRQLSGKLTISIHPLDYMTMSDNDSGWSSCMSWEEHGDYHLGTIEMMNSPYVICAYLESSSPMNLRISPFLEPVYWNNKKWRCLFICHEYAIVKVKSYPYQNESLENQAMDMISDLYPETYETISHELIELHGSYGCYRTEKESEDNWVHMHFHTGYMYNDFGHSSYSLIRFNKDFSKQRLEIIYSGDAQCIACGDTDGSFLADSVLCSECAGLNRCVCCGDYFHADELCHAPNGDQLYCNCCYNETFQWDEILKEDVYSENIDNIYLIPNELIKFFKENDILSEDGTHWNSADMLKLFGFEEFYDFPHLPTCYTCYKDFSWYQDKIKTIFETLPIESSCGDTQVYYCPIKDWLCGNHTPFINNGSHLLSKWSNTYGGKGYNQFITDIIKRVAEWKMNC